MPFGRSFFRVDCVLLNLDPTIPHYVVLGTGTSTCGTVIFTFVVVWLFANTDGAACSVMPRDDCA